MWIQLKNVRMNLSNILDYVVYDDQILFTTTYLNVGEDEKNFNFFTIELTPAEIEKVIDYLDAYFYVTSIVD